MPNKHQVCQTKQKASQHKMQSTPNKNQQRQTKQQLCEFVFQNIDLRCFVARQLSGVYALFWHTFNRPKKYGGVPKMTNIRYAIVLNTQESKTYF